jgi:hypothetical protein
MVLTEKYLYLFEKDNNPIVNGRSIKICHIFEVGLIQNITIIPESSRDAQHHNPIDPSASTG